MAPRTFDSVAFAAIVEKNSSPGSTPSTCTLFMHGAEQKNAARLCDLLSDNLIVLYDLKVNDWTW